MYQNLKNNSEDLNLLHKLLVIHTKCVQSLVEIHLLNETDQ